MKNSSSRVTPRVYRILLVEDNLDFVHTTAMLLKEMGHSVDYAVNGYVAFEVARRFRPDVVLCDLGIPGVTGFEVCQQIRKDPELQAVKIIALTAYDDDGYRKRAEQVGFDAYYTKPIDPAALYQLFGDTKDLKAR